MVVGNVPGFSAGDGHSGFLPVPAGRLPREGSAVFVIWFDDIRGSMAMKEEMSKTVDEAAFQRLRKEHDELVTEVVTRDGEGQVIKSTGDGLLALFWRPSVAIERWAEIQERLHNHAHLSVRIGMDLGEVRFESDGTRITDVFGRHVDWAARATVREIIVRDGQKLVELALETTNETGTVVLTGYATARVD